MNNVGRVSTENLMTDEMQIEDRSRRFRLLRVVAWIGFAVFTVFLIGYWVVIPFVPNFPISLIVVDVFAMFAMLAAALLLARGRFELALLLSVVSLTVTIFMAIYFINGTMGPVVLCLPLIALVAGEVGGRRYAVGTTAVYMVLYGVFVILEALGVLVPYQMPELVSRLIWVAIFIVAAVVMVVINQQFVAFMQLALSVSQQRAASLVEMSQRAQTSVVAEHTAQTRALESAHQLQEVAREYAIFLERIAAGDYTASLNLSMLAEEQNMPPELISLGEYINTTVASLVAALSEAQSAQQTYLRQSWEGLMGAGRVPGGYRYRMDEANETSQVEVVEDAWLSPMTQAVHSKNIAVDAEMLAIPIASGARAQLIGALGVRRAGQEEWSADELALVTTVTDQLAQTLENLRLLDETTRRAARERMAGEITGRIREAVEIETVLERALGELGRVFAAERGSAYLALSEQEEEKA